MFYRKKSIELNKMNLSQRLKFSVLIHLKITKNWKISRQSFKDKLKNIYHITIKILSVIGRNKFLSGSMDLLAG